MFQARRFDLVVRYAENIRGDVKAASSLLVSASGGARVPLGSVARIED